MAVWLNAEHCKGHTGSSSIGEEISETHFDCEEEYVETKGIKRVEKKK